MKKFIHLPLFLLFFCALAPSPSHGICLNPQPGGPGAPPDCKNTGGTNPFNIGTGNIHREITDLQLFAGVGQEKLAFKREMSSRYEGAVPTWLGSAGSWRHNYYWNIQPGTGWTATNEVIHIDYPDGSMNDFNLKSPTDLYLTAGPAIQERIKAPAGGDPNYYLIFPNGRRVGFTRQLSGSTATYSLVCYKDIFLNTYNFTLDAKGRVTRVTEPGGRYLQINYSSIGNFSVANVSFTYTNNTANTVTVAGDFNGWSTTANPMTYNGSVWSATIPVQLGSWQYKFVVNGNTWFSDPNNPTTSPAGGPSTGNNSVATITNGDNTTTTSAPTPVNFIYQNSTATTVYVAGDFNGWSTTANPLTQTGLTWKTTINIPNGAHLYKFIVNGNWIPDPYNPFTAPDGYGGQNSKLAVGPLDEAITSVVTSDGRSVTYSYDVATVGTQLYSRLNQASYGDGTQAIYTYAAPIYGGRPLLATANDPRYVGAASTIQYQYQGTGVEGFVSAEKSLYTGTTIASVTNPTDEVNRTLVNGNGGTETGTFLPSGLTGTRTDSLGKTTTWNYFSSEYGMLSDVTDPLGRKTTYGRTWDFGVINQTTYPDGTSVSLTFTDVTAPFYVATRTDELGRTTTYTRDGNGRPTRIDYLASSDPAYTYETFTYNAFGQVLTHRLRNGASESAAYDSTGLVLTKTDAAGNTTTYTYDTAGRVATVTDARQNTTSYAYYERGLVQRITNPDTTHRDYTYDNYGNMMSMINELGNIWNYNYDEYNRLGSVMDPLHRVTVYSYEIPGTGCSSCNTESKPMQITLPSGKKTTIAYDFAWQKTSQTVGAGSAEPATTGYVYDAAGNLTSMTDPRGKVWSYTYDVRNRKLTSTDPLSHTTTWTYDAVGNVKSITRPAPDNGLTSNVYDDMNRLTSTTDPKSQTTSYAYSLGGGQSVATMTDARSNSYSTTYDALGRKATLAYPNSSHEDWTYDNAGNTATYTTRAGQVCTYTYDNRNRQTQASWAGNAAPTVTRTYDAASRLLTLNNAASNLSYSYDAANQLASETQAIAGQTARTMGYAYDADGNRLSLTYPDSTVLNYVYTGRNQLLSITNSSSATLVSYAYDVNGNRTGRTLLNGTNITTAYDDANRLLMLDNQKTSVSFARFDYGYDVVNRRTYIKRDQAKGDAYSYDPVSQVTGVQYEATNPDTTPVTPTRTVSYLYDATGNRTSLVDNGATTPYTANTLNQYTAIDGLPAPTYDNNGNLTSQNGWTYTYDAQNRLLTAGSSGTSATFAYDAMNRCVTRTIGATTTVYYFDGWNLIDERDNGGNQLARYVNGAGTDEIVLKTSGTSSVYYQFDALGNVVALTDTNGNVVERYKYDVFGKTAIYDASYNPLGATAYGNRFQFTGREYLASVSLYDYRNRVYSQDLGRFLQNDPIRFDAKDVNLYRYVGNSVASWRDSSGLCKKKDCKASNPRTGYQDPAGMPDLRPGLGAAAVMMAVNMAGGNMKEAAGSAATSLVDTAAHKAANADTSASLINALSGMLHQFDNIGVSYVYLTVNYKECCNKCCDQESDWQNKSVDVQCGPQEGGPYGDDKAAQSDISACKAQAEQQVCNNSGT